MLSTLATALLAASPALDQAVQQAVPPGVRAEIVRVDWPKGCVGRPSLPARIDRSSRVPLRVTGDQCQAYGWIELRLFAPGLKTTRKAVQGERLAAIAEAAELELTGAAQLVTQLPPNATAKRALPAGLAISASDLELGPPAGTAITVRVALGGVVVEQRASLTPCAGVQRCARLDSGRTVRGDVVDGVLWVAAGGTP